MTPLSLDAPDVIELIRANHRVFLFCRDGAGRPEPDHGHLHVVALPDPVGRGLLPGDRHGAAFAAYEARMRPFVEKNQAIAPVARDMDFGDPASQQILLNLLNEAKVAIALDAA